MEFVSKVTILSFCECGCGKETKINKKGIYNRFITGHHCKLEKTKKKISENHADFSKENHPMWGKHHSEETKLKMSLARKGKFSGKKCPMYGKRSDKSPSWKGGISLVDKIIRRSVPNKKWRASIFERDNYTCQICGSFGKGNLEAHHLKPVSKIIIEKNIKTLDDAYGCWELWDINNGITLCEICHEKIPKRR